MYNVAFYDRHGNFDHGANIRSMEELHEVADGRRCYIVDHGEMSTEDAMIIIRGWGDVMGKQGTLEILEAMKAAKARDELTHHQDHAFDVVFNGMRKLFFGDEA